MRDLLGGKGANLAEMTNIGLPVPPGFTITTDTCNAYYANGKQVPADLMDDVTEAIARRRKADGPRVRRQRQAPARLRPLRREVLHARHDGHRSQPRPQRHHDRRADQRDRQPPLCLRRLPPLHHDAFRCGVRPEQARFRQPHLQGIQGKEGRQGRPRPERRRPAGRSPNCSWPMSANTRAASSPPIPTSSCSWRSKPCSAPGTTTAPSSTAAPRRSPTTSAPPSTSRAWSTATRATTAARASPSPATPPRAKRPCSAST